MPNTYSGTVPFAPSLGKYMYINGYEILITAPTEGLLYLPLIKSRVPVEWKTTPLTAWEGPAGADYGCITAGQVQMQGSQSGVISGDLYRQVLALLTQGPGAWSGKLGDSFDAFEKIITEIEQTESPTSEQFKKFQNIGKIVGKAIDEWLPLLDGFNNNPAAENLKGRILGYKATIESVVNKETIVKTDVITAQLPAQKLNKEIKRASILQKILQAIKDANAQGKPEVDLTAFYIELEAEDAATIGTTLPVFCAPNKYFPISFGGGRGIGNPVIIKMSEFSLSNDKTQITGLSLNGFAADIDAIWKWLDIRRDGQFKIIDVDNPTRIALENETLYLVRTPLISREVNLEWDANLTGPLAYTKTEGHDIRQISLLNTSAIYRSVIQTGFPHKSSFSKDGRKLGLEIVQSYKNELDIVPPALKITLNGIKDALKTFKSIGDKLGAINFPEFDSDVVLNSQSYNEESENSPLYKDAKEWEAKLVISLAGKDILLYGPPIPNSWKEYFDIGLYLNLSADGEIIYSEKSEKIITESSFKKTESAVAGQVVGGLGGKAIFALKKDLIVQGEASATLKGEIELGAKLVFKPTGSKSAVVYGIFKPLNLVGVGKLSIKVAGVPEIKLLDLTGTYQLLGELPIFPDQKFEFE